MKKQGNTFQTQEQEKSLETNCNEKEVSYLPNKEFKIMVIKMLTKVRRAMHEKREFQQRENIKKHQTEITELKNIITEVKILI